ncbi:hypothetical protein RIF29_11975 [Crotalaria pallida]|uniref:EF-hand domain-containing protein n=1 Tax=Crotalaria pallida TaxID=3830 RepID=A0AAN9P1C2_CROPI
MLLLLHYLEQRSATPSSMNCRYLHQLTFGELKTGLARIGSRLSEAEVKQLMEAADVDGNGSIDYIEFISATMHRHRLERDEHLYKAFQYFDKDSSGQGKKELTRTDVLYVLFAVVLHLLFCFNSIFVQKREAKFTSRQPASVIISKLEEIAKQLNLKINKRATGLLKLEDLKEGKKGILSIDADIFEVTPSFHSMEVKKSDGGEKIRWRYIGISENIE